MFLEKPDRFIPYHLSIFNMEDNDDALMMMDAEAAAASLEEIMDQWTSPHLRETTTSSFRWKKSLGPSFSKDEEDDEAWLYESFEEDNKEKNEQQQEGFRLDPMLFSADSPASTLLLTPIPPPTTLHRANTPVMSNSTSSKKEKKQQQRTILSATLTTPADKSIAPNVQSPLYSNTSSSTIWKQQQPPNSIHKKNKITTNTSSRTTSRHLIRHPTRRSIVYSRYHDALRQYIRAKRNSLQQQQTMELEFLNRLADAAAAADSPSSSSSSLLSTTCLRRERRFWWLLMELRKLGIDALIFHNGSTKTTESSSSLPEEETRAYLETMARQYVDATNSSIVSILYNKLSSSSSSSPPLHFQRLYKIRLWIEKSFAREMPSLMPARIDRPILSSKNPIDTIFQPTATRHGTIPVDTTTTAEEERKVVSECLQFLLAGRMADALTHARNRGLAWRAALWSGGNANNPKRFLWKHALFRQHAAETTLAAQGSSGSSYPEESAMASLLSGNLNAALKNPALRTFEKGLLAIVRAQGDRIEDQLLHECNQQRRRNGGPPFPGCQFPTLEVRHLQNTSSVAHLTMQDIIDVLQSAPYPEMHWRHDPILQATCSILVGTTHIQDFMDRSTQNIIDTSSSSSSGGDTFVHERETTDWDSSAVLRFVTHFALYLDSIVSVDDLTTRPASAAASSEENFVVVGTSSSSTGALQGVTEWKNEMVLAYWHHISQETREPDFWHLWVLYASLLPESVILYELPAALARIESPAERQTIRIQLAEYLPQSGLDRKILRRVVRIVLNETQTEADGEENALAELDFRKMHAILWLCDDSPPRACGDALILANALIRQFLLADHPDKIHSAQEFVDQVFPSSAIMDGARAASSSSTLEEADNSAVQDMEQEEFVGMDDDEETGENILDDDKFERQTRIENAISEHSAFLSFLDAIKVVESWKITLETTHADQSKEDVVTMDEGFSSKKWNTAAEAAIATSLEQRKIIEEKRKRCQAVAMAADKARLALEKILKHPGGWLLTEDEIFFAEEENDKEYDDWPRRRQELEHLRKKLLPNVVLRYHDICVETAAWMAMALDDAVERMGENAERNHVLKQIEESLGGEVADQTSPISPRFWTQRAMELAQTTVSDSYCIRSAFRTSDFKDLMAKLAETTVSDIMYATDLS
jgi:hypothetical protein